MSQETNAVEAPQQEVEEKVQESSIHDQLSMEGDSGEGEAKEAQNLTETEASQAAEHIKNEEDKIFDEQGQNTSEKVQQEMQNPNGESEEVAQKEETEKEVHESEQKVNREEVDDTEEAKDGETVQNEAKDESASTEESKDADEPVPELSDDEIEIGSELESDSSSSSSSDSSSDSSDDEDNEDEEFSDVEEEKITGPITSKNEILNEVAPDLPEGYELGDKPIEPIGEITGFVENSIIIKGEISAEFRVLKEKSILCLKGKVLGPLFEIFGNLKSPIYRIKFNEPGKVDEFKEFKGHKVYYVVPDSQFTLTDTLKAFKGSDASNFNDEELPEEEQEFSDDEKEMAAKRKRKGGSDKKKDKKKQKQALAKSRDQYESNHNSAQQFTSYNPPSYQPSAPGYQQPQSAPSYQPQSQPYQQYQPQQPQVQQYPPYNAPQAYQAPPNPNYPSHLPQIPQVPPQPQQQAYGQQYHQQFYPNQYPQAYGTPYNAQPNMNANPVNPQLNAALSNATPEQLKLLEQLIQSQLNNNQQQ